MIGNESLTPTYNLGGGNNLPNVMAQWIIELGYSSPNIKSTLSQIQRMGLDFIYQDADQNFIDSTVDKSLSEYTSDDEHAWLTFPVPVLVDFGRWKEGDEPTVSEESYYITSVKARRPNSRAYASHWSRVIGDVGFYDIEQNPQEGTPESLYAAEPRYALDPGDEDAIWTPAESNSKRAILAESDWDSKNAQRREAIPEHPDARTRYAGGPADAAI